MYVLCATNSIPLFPHRTNGTAYHITASLLTKRTNIYKAKAKAKVQKKKHISICICICMYAKSIRFTLTLPLSATCSPPFVFFLQHTYIAHQPRPARLHRKLAAAARRSSRSRSGSPVRMWQGGVEERRSSNYQLERPPLSPPRGLMRWAIERKKPMRKRCGSVVVL